MSGYFYGRNGRLLKTLEDLRGSAETGRVAEIASRT